MVSMALQTPGRCTLALKQTVSAIVQVGARIHEDVAHPFVMLQDRDAGVLRHEADQALAAPGDDEVHQFVLLQKFQGGLPGDARDDLHRRLGRPGLLQGLLHQLGQGHIGVDGLLAALQDHGVAAFETEGGGVHRDVGPGLVNKADHPEGDALAPDF